MRRAAAASSCVLAAIGVAACGASGNSTPQAEVRASYLAFNHDLERQLFGAVCARMTRARQRSIVDEVDQALKEAPKAVSRATPSITSCSEAVRLAAGPHIGAAARATRVESIRVEGDRATITATRPGGERFTFDVVHEGDAWLLEERSPH